MIRPSGMNEGFRASTATLEALNDDRDAISVKTAVTIPSQASSDDRAWSEISAAASANDLYIDRELSDTAQSSRRWLMRSIAAPLVVHTNVQMTTQNLYNGGLEDGVAAIVIDNG